MQFTATYELPEHVVMTLRQHWNTLARINLEDLAVIGYNMGILTSYQIQQILKHALLIVSTLRHPSKNSAQLIDINHALFKNPRQSCPRFHVIIPTCSVPKSRRNVKLLAFFLKFLNHVFT